MPRAAPEHCADYTNRRGPGPERAGASRAVTAPPAPSGRLTLNLRSEKYGLFCNVPGHYMSGMWALLTVN